MKYICKCGRIEDAEPSVTYIIRKYNEDGHIIFEMCKHGIITVNLLEETDELYDIVKTCEYEINAK